MYLLQAPQKKFGLIPPNTALITDEVKFTNNYAFTHKYYWKKIHCQNGCIDITPKAIENIRKKRELKTVTFIAKGGIGDCLWTMPAVKMFRELNPKCYIFIITEAKSKLIWKNCQYINGFAEDGIWNTENVIRKAEDVLEFGGVATVFKDQMKLDPVEAIFKIMGYKIPKDKSKMRPDLTVTVDEGEAAKKYLKDKGIDIEKDKIITIGLDASTSNRHYPIDFIKMVSEKLVEQNIKVIWMGKTEEYRADLINDKYKIKGVTNITCETNIREAMAILALSDLHINPNSGLLVISTALNIPTIGLFGAFEPKIRCKFYERFKALYVPTDCSPCNEHWTECRHGHPAPCMKNITPGLLYKTCMQMLKENPRYLIEKLPIK